MHEKYADIPSGSGAPTLRIVARNSETLSEIEGVIEKFRASHGIKHYHADMCNSNRKAAGLTAGGAVLAVSE